MVDETFGQPVANDLNEKIKSLKAKTTFECGLSQGAADRAVIDACRRDGRILLTFDHNTIDRWKYPPCSHAGIMIIKYRDH
jgi:hypothetical protein